MDAQSKDTNSQDFAAAYKVKQEELFQPFQWIDNHSREARLASAVMNMALGIRTILEVIDEDSMRRDCDDPPIFNDYHRGALLRLANESCWALHLQAEEVITHLKKQKNRKPAI